MSTLNETIVGIEKEWLKPLYLHVDGLFSGTNLPSHDADHHLRVWVHCRELMLELEKAGVPIDEETIKQSLIACFFHDTGLLKDLGENHGAESRLLCRLYLVDHPEFAVKNTESLLHAIEKHDDKSEKNIEANNIEEVKTTHRLITTADDLDAFGFIGVFRYLEIYIKRNVDTYQIPGKIISNLKGRFNNFWQSYSFLQQYAQLQKIRYSQTLGFFANLDAQLSARNQLPNGYVEVFNILFGFVASKQSDLTPLISEILETSTSDFVLTFFKRLKSENETISSLKHLITKQ